MKYSYHKQSNFKIVFYAVGLALIFGIGIIIVQDIQVPSEHISKEISIKIEK